jgi:leucyl-tRNA synthetase
LADGSTADAIDPRLLAETPTGAADAETASRKKAGERMIHTTIQKVSEDIERMSFNTAISQMMVCVNEFFSRKEMGRAGAEVFVKLLGPFAPHLAEELWKRLGHADSLSGAAWPNYDPARVAADEIEVVFQVNGKVRGKSLVPAGINEEDLKAQALADENVQRNLDGKTPAKIIVVKNKLVNIVVGK